VVSAKDILCGSGVLSPHWQGLRPCHTSSWQWTSYLMHWEDICRLTSRNGTRTLRSDSWGACALAHSFMAFRLLRYAFPAKTHADHRMLKSHMSPCARFLRPRPRCRSHAEHLLAQKHLKSLASLLSPTGRTGAGLRVTASQSRRLRWPPACCASTEKIRSPDGRIVAAPFAGLHRHSSLTANHPCAPPHHSEIRLDQPACFPAPQNRGRPPFNGPSPTARRKRA